jgi:hypothetical protein
LAGVALLGALALVPALALVGALVAALVVPEPALPARAGAALAAAFFFLVAFSGAADREERGISHLGGPAIGGASG